MDRRSFEDPVESYGLEVRDSMRIGFTPVSLVVMTLSTTAAAWDNRPETSRHIDLALRLGVLGTDADWMAPIGILGGLEGHYRLLPHLRMGAYFQYTSVMTTSSDEAAYDAFAGFSANRWGVRAEGHMFPELTVDPWLGATVGAYHVSDSTSTANTDFRKGGTGWDCGVEGGIDFHLGYGIALGGLFELVVPLNRRELFGDSNYYTLLPVPTLRLTVSF